MESVFKPKLFTLLRSGISKEQVGRDIMAGIVVGIVALPLAIAFGVASGVSPEKGLITAIVAGFIVSLLGGSRVQIGGPTGAFIIIVYGIVKNNGFEGLLISTVLAGIFLVAFGFLRLGSLLKYIPQPLIIGFTSAIALTIFTTQIKDALGLTITDMPDSFIGKWGAYFSGLDTFNPWAFGIMIATVLIGVYTPKLIKRVPGSFIAIVLMTAVVAIFDLPVVTIETLYGDIPNTISVSALKFDLSNIGDYIQPAITIALLGAIESLLSAVVADGMISGHHRSNTELIAQGIANIATPFFGGIPATGAIARTATNIKNGGRTPIAGIVHAAVLLLIVLFFGRFAKLIPMSVLAGILIVVAYNMSEWRLFRSVVTRSGTFDRIILLVTFFLTVLVDLTVAIEVGIVLAALMFMKRMSDLGTNLEESRDMDYINNYGDLPDEIGVYEISGPFFFGSAKHYCNVMRELGLKYKVMILRMRNVPFIDATAVVNLAAMVADLEKGGTKVVLSGVRQEVRTVLERSDNDMIHTVSISDNFTEAVEIAKMAI
ncbi:MAG: SulP family inorganic anion transporter [Rikenellaceae bacterium]|nr:SulP family inorganic anion transporter [Rikenellaceae bacterium]